MIAGTAVAEEMLRIAGVIVEDSEAFGAHSFPEKVDPDLLEIAEPAAEERYRGFEISSSQQMLALPDWTW